MRAAPSLAARDRFYQFPLRRDDRHLRLGKRLNFHYTFPYGEVFFIGRPRWRSGGV